MTTKDNGERWWMKKVQIDLDNGNFNRICGNETLFKTYVFKLAEEVESQAESRLRAQIRKDITRAASEKHENHDEWEQGDCDCDGVFDYKEILSLPSISEAGDNGEGA